MTEKTINLPGHLSRREAMQWVLASVAASALPTDSFADAAKPASTSSDPGVPVSAGYGKDPKLNTAYKPGAFWPLLMTDVEKRTTRTLADVIIPKDQFGPAASAVGVPAMLDEWVSAPYPKQEEDRPVILKGLAWIEAEASKRFGKSFSDLEPAQHQAICDDICHHASAKKEFKTAATFFSRFRSLAAGAYYATPAGWQALGYVGNTPMAQFDGPPAEVLQKLGVTQTVT